MKLERKLENNVQKWLNKGKAIIIIGARQVGKTTLARKVLSQYRKTLVLNCEDPEIRSRLSNKGLESLSLLIGSNEAVLFDEAQYIEDIGVVLKLLVDHFKNTKQFIVTGSSAFNLLTSTQEPLTGRKIVFNMYPIAISELFDKEEVHLKFSDENILKYGLYPEVVNQNSEDEKLAVLRELTSSYLYKDILEFQNVKNPEILRNLLKLLAGQIGSEVSYTEIAGVVGIDKNTVESYVDLLEKNNIVFRLTPYYKKGRREISKLRKIYFYDLGIRNALLNNFNDFKTRTDKGGLWENFIISERLKFRNYSNIFVDQYFWRTYDGNEIDLVEDGNNILSGFEIKHKQTKLRLNESWAKYPNSTLSVIHRENFWEYLY